VFGYEAFPAEILRHAIDKPHPESKICSTENTESTGEECTGIFLLHSEWRSQEA
jgi:hypothetical protein